MPAASLNPLHLAPTLGRAAPPRPTPSLNLITSAPSPGLILSSLAGLFRDPALGLFLGSAHRQSSLSRIAWLTPMCYGGTRDLGHLDQPLLTSPTRGEAMGIDKTILKLMWKSRKSKTMEESSEESKEMRCSRPCKIAKHTKRPVIKTAWY